METEAAWFKRNDADLGMVVFTMVAALNYVVMRDAVSDFAPLTFNALRFLIGACIMLPLLLFRIRTMHFSRSDLRWLLSWGAVSLVATQVLLVSSLHVTTSTNVALLIATTPTWTAVFGIISGSLTLRRGLVMGLGVTLAGASIVVLARSDGEWSLSHDDLIGCLMALGSAISSAWYMVATKRYVDHYGHANIAILKHLTVVVGTVAIALPSLLALRPGDVPQDIVPNLLYGGLVATITGSLAGTFAQRKIGPTRTMLYQNITPLATAVLGFLLLGETISLSLAAGGMLTLSGVWIVRHNLHAAPFKQTPHALPVH